MRQNAPHNSFYCIYPPCIANDVDVTEQQEGGTLRYVIRNRASSRYFMIKAPEYRVFQQFDGTQALTTIAQGGKDGDAPRVAMATLIKFLQKMDSFGLLEYKGVTARAVAKKVGNDLYPTFKLFNPSRLLAWLDHRFGWLLTKPFIIASFLLMAFVALAMFSIAPTVAAYTAYIYSEYGFSTLVVFTLAITMMHEFAHGWACKHFGGDVEEMGVLMIFYVLPAMYCNVSDIYRIGKRSERLWVIGAGIYWQLCVGAWSALIWLIATPYTVLADVMFLTFLGGTLNVLVNCNPLIKLDGYYALSQMLGIQNLQTQAAAYVRSLPARLFGTKTEPQGKQPRPFLFVSYWLLSIVYSLCLIGFVLSWASDWLMNTFGFLGVFLTLWLAARLTRRWWRKPVEKAKLAATSRIAAIAQRWNQSDSQFQTSDSRLLEGVTNMSAQTVTEKISSPTTKTAGEKKILVSSSLLIKAAILILLGSVLLLPWEASTGSDCTLMLPTGHEMVTRANTDAVLTEIYVQQGDAVREGAKLARFTNPELEDRLTQINAEIKRLESNNSRIEDELRVRSELMLSANLKETERKRLSEELQGETKQIKSSNAASLPASLSILQSEVELKQTELEHNRREVDRYKKLLEQQLVGTQIYDRAVAAMKVSEKELQTAKARLESAIIEHRRLTNSTETSSLVAETEARAARSNFEALIAELHANREQLEALRQRQEILQHEFDGMILTAPRSGVVLGDDLQKSIGRHYNRGEEIFRIGELEKFILKIDVSEREISNVRVDSPVRFKLKTVPGKTFTGLVSKINAEPTTNQLGQHFYPVEVQVENADGLLRPGMTGFARISFGRQKIGAILIDKVWQALRPELWLF